MTKLEEQMKSKIDKYEKLANITIEMLADLNDLIMSDEVMPHQISQEIESVIAALKLVRVSKIKKPKKDKFIDINVNRLSLVID